MTTDQIPQAPSLDKRHIKTFVEALLIMATPTDADGAIAQEAMRAVARFCVLHGCPRAQFVRAAEVYFDEERDACVKARMVEGDAPKEAERG
jgi:hypothetical protein